MRRREFVTVIGGVAAMWPIKARAQQPPWRLAGVHPGRQTSFLNEEISPRYWRPFFDELRSRGFVEGGNLKVERHFGDGRTQGYSKLAQAVVATVPDVILCMSTRMTAHMKAATSNIPIVAFASDPVTSGLVSSLAHPGGNITGVAPDVGLEFYAKNLELLRAVVPAASRIAYLTPRAVWESPILLAPVREAASRAGVSLVPALLDSPIQGSEYRRAFALVAEARVDGLIVGESPENHSHSSLIVDLAARSRIPAVYPERYFAVSGGLVSYGVDYPSLFRRVGAQIAQVLGGTKPGTIPFVQGSRFELVINLKTAKALGLSVPESLLVAATEVIE